MGRVWGHYRHLSRHGGGSQLPAAIGISACRLVDEQAVISLKAPSKHLGVYIWKTTVGSAGEVPGRQTAPSAKGVR